jgi:DNA-binding response OmpR family regulator
MNVRREQSDTTPHALVVDADPALFGLLEEWLGDEGWCVLQPGPNGTPQHAELIIVDVPYPRTHGVDSVERLAAQHPSTPIVALSSTFFACIERCGPVARALGVACVLPTPVSRERLVDAVRSVCSA